MQIQGAALSGTVCRVTQQIQGNAVVVVLLQEVESDMLTGLVLANVDLQLPTRGAATEIDLNLFRSSRSGVIRGVDVDDDFGIGATLAAAPPRLITISGGVDAGVLGGTGGGVRCGWCSKELASAVKACRAPAKSPDWSAEPMASNAWARSLGWKTAPLLLGPFLPRATNASYACCAPAVSPDCNAAPSSARSVRRACGRPGVAEKSIPCR